jgi:hypothetical protein
MSIRNLADQQRRQQQEAALRDQTFRSLEDLLQAFVEEALPQVRDSLDDSTELGEIELTWQIPDVGKAYVLDRDRPHVAATWGRRHTTMIRVPGVSNTELAIWPFNWVWFRENRAPQLCLPHVGTGFRCEATDAILPLLCDSSLLREKRVWSRKAHIDVHRWFCTWRGHEDNHKIRSWVLGWLAGRHLKSELRPKRLY